MTWRFLDWKFLVTLAVTILGVVVPVVWQSDPSSKSMELRLNSIISLEPASQIHDLQLMLDGKKLESPYSTTVELVNTGSKSVLSKDFDKPIEITVEDGAQVITARITGTSPSDIPVEISTTDRIVRIAPHLSNSGDSVSLNIITSGKKPVYSVRARIAGISHVTYTDLTLPKSPYIRYLKPVFQGLSAWMMFCLSVMFAVAVVTPQDFGTPRVVSVFVAIGSYTGGTQLMALMVEGLELQNRWEILAPMLAIAAALAVACSGYLTIRWNRFARNLSTERNALGSRRWP
jgi:hypothetical protein